MASIRVNSSVRCSTVSYTHLDVYKRQLTGYAGPGGGTEDDPAGTVYIGVYDRGATRCVRCSFEGDRNEVRARAALFALDELINCCSYM